MMTNNENNNAIQDDLRAAQALIKEGKYDEARRILIPLDHPIADKWLARINDITASEPDVIVVQDKKRGGCLRNIGLAILALIACSIILSLFDNSTNPNTSTANVPDEAGNTQAPETGSRALPHPPNGYQYIQDGRFRVNNIRYNMSAHVESVNIFNPDPEVGEEWVLVNATFYCELPADEVCRTNQMRFDLVGDSGRAYQNEVWVDLSEPFADEVFGGGLISGDIAFLVDTSDDNNLLFAVNQFGQRMFFALP